MSPQPLAVIRPGRTRGPWMLVTQNGGSIIWQTRDWARCVEVARALIEAVEWDHTIDTMERPC